MTWLPSRRVQRKSTRNDRSPSMGWGRATCSRGSAKPCSIIAARASDSPPLSLCASAQYIVLMACRVPACPLLIRRNWETKETGLLPVRRSALSATASACPKRAVLMQSNVVRGSGRDAKPLSEDEFVALDDVPPDGACAGGAVCPARRNVDVAQPLERHGQAERHCRRFVAERPVGVQGLQRTHQVKHALGRRDRAPVRGARVHAPRRSHDLSAFDLPLQARADAGVVGDEERLREFRLREEGSRAPYRSSSRYPPSAPVPLP